jgi:hypothetical protein
MGDLLGAIADMRGFGHESPVVPNMAGSWFELLAAETLRVPNPLVGPGRCGSQTAAPSAS